jgi:predicted esterase
VFGESDSRNGLRFNLFLVHASDDESVPVENSLRFYRALRKHKAAAELHVYEIGEKLETW